MRVASINEKKNILLWAEAVGTAYYTQNRSMICLRHGKTPYELLHNKTPDLSFLHVFGALCYPINDCENLGKLQPKADIGPVLHEITPTTISSGLVPNPPPSTPFVPPSRSDWDILFQPLFDELHTPPPNVDLPAPEVIAPIVEVVSPEPADSTGSPSSTTVDQHAPSASNSQSTTETQSPVISNDVEEDNHDLDVAYMNNDQFFGIPIPEYDSEASSSSDVIPTVVHTATPYSEHVNKWTKDHPLENIIGELQRPTALTQAAGLKPNARGANREFELLKSMEHHLRCPDKVKNLCMHGNALLSNFLLTSRFLPRVPVDPHTVHRQTKGNDILLVQIYVDDIIFASTTPELCDEFSKIICSKFKMSMMGKFSFFVGLQIFQNPRGIFINQSKYALESLKTYGMESSDPVDTPMVEKSELDEDPQGKAVDPTHYHGMVGTFMYLTASRPYLTFVVCMCARYQAKPTEKHLHSIKRIFKYLRGTVNRGLWYPNDSSIALIAYTDCNISHFQVYEVQEQRDTLVVNLS
ncbi:retrovirus-related pol polyprotein from transposon TNT 1-94 [Tanacetum coccineum]